MNFKLKTDIQIAGTLIKFKAGHPVTKIQDAYFCGGFMIHTDDVGDDTNDNRQTHIDS